MRRKSDIMTPTPELSSNVTAARSSVNDLGAPATTSSIRGLTSGIVRASRAPSKRRNMPLTYSAVTSPAHVSEREFERERRFASERSLAEQGSREANRMKIRRDADRECTIAGASLQARPHSSSRTDRDRHAGAGAQDEPSRGDRLDRRH